MRFYKGAHDYIHKVGQISDVFDQCLYLVPEPNNQYDSNAVMLHNGKIKLGSVEASDAARLRLLFQQWKNENGGGNGGEDVVVVKLDRITVDPQTFAFTGSIKIRGMYRVNERLARKFSNIHRKD